jgi:hypothetical protein
MSIFEPLLTQKKQRTIQACLKPSALRHWVTTQHNRSQPPFRVE